ncbi:MAG: class I SAM-dependent methyltransferase [Christensenellales bacterium]|jgi:SAM-dependent methyltransferase
MFGENGRFSDREIEAYERHVLKHATGDGEIYNRTADALGLKGAAHLLDLGCGTGRALDEIMKRSPWISVTGIDRSPALLARLLAKPYASRLTLIHADSIQAALGTERYDAAVSVLVMHLSPREDRRALYARIHQSLRPGGRYVEADIAARDAAEEDRLFAEAAYERPLTEDSVLGDLRTAGFSSVETYWKHEQRAIYVARKDGKK